ncbi:hypothetical protein Aple_071100 [Acrocarpospora pleiomorpha]|uniref:Uncharacterized protein n=1 Tax=Acrocarpospora pleiomorpha TaxID=90975 RepID=A0A5M3XXC8_9ACTN|nr:hypothetical protein Aple_071100 [Acrocarpospora pleiomorpha]
MRASGATNGGVLNHINATNRARGGCLHYQWPGQFQGRLFRAKHVRCGRQGAECRGPAAYVAVETCAGSAGDLELNLVDTMSRSLQHAGVDVRVASNPVSFHCVASQIV